MKRLLASSFLIPFVANGQLIVNEVLYDPPQAADANGDGTSNFSDDEFIEFVNTSVSSLDMEGWSINDNAGERHVFPPGTVLAPGQAIVVFGGGTPTGSFGGALVQTADSSAFQGNSLGLNNGGDSITILDSGGTEIVFFDYPDIGNADESIARTPDLTGDNVFENHSAIAATGGSLFSPGTQLDGSDFDAPTPLVLSFDPAVLSEGGGDTASMGTVTRSGDLSAPLIVSLAAADSETVILPESVTIPAGMDSVSFDVGTMDDEFQEFTQSVFVSAAADGFSTVGLRLQVEDNEPVISLTTDLDEIDENGGVAMITITVSEASPDGYAFDLFSENISLLTVPASVMIPVGETSVTIAATAIDNDDPGVPQPVSVTVSDVAANLFEQSISIIVNDDEGIGVPPLFISEIADPGGDGGFAGRFMELYNPTDEAIDLDQGSWNLVVYINGADNPDGREVALTGIVPARGTYIIANSFESYNNLYPSAPEANVESGNFNPNGDDGFELRLGGGQETGILVDRYGIAGVDGTGENWEYENSRVIRTANVTEPNSNFTLSEWVIMGSAIVSDMTPGVYDAVLAPVTDLETLAFTIDPVSGVGTIIIQDAGLTNGYNLVVSNDLDQADAWASVMTQSLADNGDGTLTISFTDAAASGQAKRFYRVEEGAAVASGVSAP